MRNNLDNLSRFGCKSETNCLGSSPNCLGRETNCLDFHYLGKILHYLTKNCSFIQEKICMKMGNFDDFTKFRKTYKYI